jgi:predicted metal-dependent phosphoesterase TrpH
MVADFHLHTDASDGEMDPSSLVERAAAHGVTRLSITDHDTLAAYRREGGAVVHVARRLGVELAVGIELDVALDGREVHVLGLGLNAEAPDIGAHLAVVRAARLARARRDLALVNGRLGAGTLRAEQVFAPGRDALMRVHFIRPLMDEGRFASYGEGREWFHANSEGDVRVPKPSMAEAIGMIHGAGGVAVLAHPAYCWKDGFPILESLPRLRALGLDGVELDYPYRSSSPELFSEADAEWFTGALRSAGEALALRFTRGSDAHRPGDFDRVYGPAPSRPWAGETDA